MTYRPRSAAAFAVYCKDLAYCQRRQARENGYVGIHAITSLDAWLRYFGWRRWEGILKQAWRVFVCSTIEPDAAKLLGRLLELWDERRDVWMRPGGYLVKADGHRRGTRSAPIHKQTLPPPWRLSSSQSRQRANARKPNTVGLNAEIDGIYAKFNLALETQGMQGRLPIAILALAGSIQSGTSMRRG